MKMRYGFCCLISVAFLILLSISPLFEYCIYDGINYLAGFMGITALLYCLFSKYTLRGNSLIGVILIFFVVNFRQDVELGMLTRILSFCAVWMFAIKMQRNKSYQRWTLVALAVSGVIQTGIGFIQFTKLGWNVKSYTDISGSFANSGPLGGYLSVIYAMLFPYIAYCKNEKRWQIFFIVCTSIIGAGCIMSFSRAAMSSLVLCSVLYVVLNSKYFGRHIQVCVSASFLLGIVFAIAMYILRPLSVDARLQIWSISLHIMRSAPILGHGTDSFGRLFMPAQAAYFENSDCGNVLLASDNTLAYNDTIKLCCEQGIAGVILVGGVACMHLAQMYRSFMKNKSCVWLFPLIAYIIFSQFSYPSSVWSINMLLPVIAGYGFKNNGFPPNLNYKSRLVFTWLQFIVLVCLVYGLFVRVYLNTRLERFYMIKEEYVFEQQHVLFRYYVTHDYNMLSYYSKSLFLRGTL